MHRRTTSDGRPPLPTRRRLRLGLPAALAALAGTALAGFAVAGPGAAPALAVADPPVSVWETTTDQSQLLAPQTGTSFASGSSSQGTNITITPSQTYQTMTGFGASFTDSSAWLV